MKALYINMYPYKGLRDAKKTIQHHHIKDMGKRKKKSIEKVEDSSKLHIIKNYRLHNLSFFYFLTYLTMKGPFIVKTTQML